MRWLTYADREFLLRTFDSLRRDWKGSDADLLLRLSEWSSRLAPHFGFERTLTRDIVALSRYLHTHSSDQDVVDIARGVLIYVLFADQSHPSRLLDFGLLDEAFLCNYALHEIRLRLGESATYLPPRLTRDEQSRAETLFLRFIEEPILPDERLIEEAKVLSQKVGNFGASCLFGRLKKNIEFLSFILFDESCPDEHRAYARAALSYVVCADDAIDDSFGLVGYLDDYFIAQLAVDFLEPARTPWLELLDDTIGFWPFLSQILLEQKGDARPLSEYMIINSALSCSDLRSDNGKSTVLITPFVGPTPFLLGMMVTLGLIQKIQQHEVSESSFHHGQKVLVDYSAVREFAGFFQMKDGRKMFGLRRYRVRQSESSKEIDYWPMSDLWRLVPAPASRSLRGQIMHNLDRSGVELPSLEYIFNTNGTVQVFGIEKQVIVVTPVSSAHEMATRLRLFGRELKDVVPMGHVTTKQEVKPWSNRFGQQEPLLLFVSDLDLACAFMEERQERCHSVIIDATERNAHKTASLRQLQHSPIPTLILIAERVAAQLNPEKEDNVSIWEWDEEDFSALLWPPLTDKNYTNPIVRYESLLQTRRADSIETISLSFPPARCAFDAVRQLRTLARQRGEDHLTELDNIVSLSFRLLSWLLRLATPLTDDAPLTALIDSHLQELDTIRGASLYLSDAERVATQNAEDVLEQLFTMLRSENKKAESLRSLLIAQPQLSIICPDARLRTDLERTYADLGTRIVGSWDDDDGKLHGSIIPGWFGSDRMAALLVPPVTKPLYLVLYDIEEGWHSDFRRERQRHRAARSARSDRAKLFPQVKGWSKPAAQPPETIRKDHDTGLQTLEEIHQYVGSIYRQHVYKAARSDGTEAEVPARLIVFDGGAHAFLTESHKINIVTHLLDVTVEDEREEEVGVKEATVKELKHGDAVLFHRRSERDVVRTVADEELAAGVRRTSSLWRVALTHYVECEHVTPRQLWERLKAGGCSVSLQTVREWLTDTDRIAPREYTEQVPIVAAVTKDEMLNNQLTTVLHAIRMVFSAHQRASHRIARQVLRRAVEVLREENRQSSLIEIESNIVLVRVAEIDDSTTQTRVSIVNRLQEPEQ